MKSTSILLILAMVGCGDAPKVKDTQEYFYAEQAITPTCETAEDTEFPDKDAKFGTVTQDGTCEWTKVGNEEGDLIQEGK